MSSFLGRPPPGKQGATSVRSKIHQRNQKPRKIPQTESFVDLIVSMRTVPAGCQFCENLECSIFALSTQIRDST